MPIELAPKMGPGSPINISAIINELLNKIFIRANNVTIEEIATAFRLTTDKNYSKEDIQKSLAILERLSIVRKDENIYRLTRSIKEIQSDIQLLYPSKQIIKPPKLNPDPTVPSYVKAYLEQLESPNTLASLIRQTIQQRQRISHKELEEEVTNAGYQISGGVVATLKVLRDHTNEIRQTGKGDDKEYEWNKT